MFFTKKKHHKEKVRVEHIDESHNKTKDYYEDIKKAMDEEPVYAENPAHVEQQTRVHEIGPKMPYPDAPSAAPLFVKVDKYREILKDVQEVRLSISGMKQIMDLMNDVDSIKLEGIKMLRATIHRLDKTMTEIDSDLLRPRGAVMDEIGREDVEVRHIETSLTELQKQLGDLKRELSEFR